MCLDTVVPLFGVNLSLANHITVAEVRKANSILSTCKYPLTGAIPFEHES